MTRTATSIRTPFGILVLQDGAQAAASTLGTLTYSAAGTVEDFAALHVPVTAVDTGVTGHVLLFQDGTRQVSIGATAGETYTVDLDLVYPDGVPSSFWVLVVPDIDGQRGKGAQVRVSVTTTFENEELPQLVINTVPEVGEALTYVEGQYSLTPDTVTQTLEHDQGTDTWTDVTPSADPEDNTTIPELPGSRLRIKEVAELSGYDTLTTYSDPTAIIQEPVTETPATLTPAQILQQASDYVDDPTNLFFKCNFVITGIPTTADVQWAVTNDPIADGDWNDFEFQGITTDLHGVWRPEMTDEDLRYPDPLANNTSPRQDFSCHRAADASRTNVAVRWRPTGTTTWSAASARETVPLPVEPVVAPVNTILPTVTGAQYREGVALTGTTGTWTGNPTFTQNWQRAQVDISAATSLSYTPVQADVDNNLRLKVVATNSAGSTTAFSLETPVIVDDDPFPDPDPDPTGFFPVPAVPLGDATGKALTRFIPSGGEGTSNAGWFGPAMVIEAYAAFAGQTQADSHVLAQFRYNLQGGNCPTGSGGIGLQHQCYFTTAAAIVKRIPRLWDDEFTGTERTKIELLVKAMLIGAAATGSDNAPQFGGSYKSFTNSPDWNTGANTNARNAKPLTVLAARSFLGGDSAVTTFLNGLDHASFATSLNAQGLTNAYQVHNNPSPWSHAQIENAVQDWTFRGFSISEYQEMILAAHQFCFQHTVTNGLNNGAGITHEGTVRAKVLTNPSPSRTELGKIGMIQELDSQDAEGKRSSMHYSMWDQRISMQMFLIMMCDGTLDRTSTTIQNLKTRVHNGMLDFRYKCSPAGYWNYAHGGEGSNNDQWTQATKATQYGWSYSLSMWFDIIKPWLDSDDPDPEPDPDPDPDPDPNLKHPKTVHTAAELVTIKSRITAGTAPQTAARNNLISVANTNLNFTPNPAANYYFDGQPNTGISRTAFVNNSRAAYSCAEAYKLTNDTRYADKAVAILDAWARKDSILNPPGKSHPGLHFGSHAVQFMYAVDLLRGYGPWEAVLPRFKSWWENRCEPNMRAVITEKMPQRTNPTASTSEGTNWLDAALNHLMAAGIAFERTALRDEMIERLGQYFNGNWRLTIDNLGPNGSNTEVLVRDSLRNQDGEILGVQYTGYAMSSIVQAMDMAANHGANYWSTATSAGVTIQDIAEQWYRWNFNGEQLDHPNLGAGAPIKVDRTDHNNIFERCCKNLTMSAGFIAKMESLRPINTSPRDGFVTLTAGDL